MHGYSLLRTQLNNDYFRDIFDESRRFECDVEGHRKYRRFRFTGRAYVNLCFTHYLDTETGPGVFETALAYTSALRMADNALLFKYLVKSLGLKYSILPSFMAKPWGNVCL